jgi:hypothetical protein
MPDYPAARLITIRPPTISFNLNLGTELLILMSGFAKGSPPAPSGGFTPGHWPGFYFLSMIMTGGKALQSTLKTISEDDFRLTFSLNCLAVDWHSCRKSIQSGMSAGRVFYSKKRLNPNKTEKAGFSVPFFAKAFFEPCKRGRVAVRKINRLGCMKIHHGCFFQGC